MTLQEIYEQLAHGELRMLNIGEVGSDGSLLPENYDKVLPHVNAGLTALHKRFLIRQGTVDVALQPGRYDYHLSSVHALSNSRSLAEKYILDSEHEPFKDDLIKIERIYLDTGFEPALNDYADPCSFTTSSLRTIQAPKRIVEQDPQLPQWLKAQTFTVLYRANHPKLTEDDGADFPEDMEVDLPDLYLEPLLYYIASRLHNPTGMVNEFHMGNSYYAKYEAACREIENTGLYISQHGQDDRIKRNGWV